MCAANSAPIISSLSPEDRQKLLSQLNRQVQVDNVLVTDDHNAYNRVPYGTKARHEVIPANQHRKKEKRNSCLKTLMIILMLVQMV